MESMALMLWTKWQSSVEYAEEDLWPATAPRRSAKKRFYLLLVVHDQGWPDCPLACIRGASGFIFFIAAKERRRLRKEGEGDSVFVHPVLN